MLLGRMDLTTQLLEHSNGSTFPARSLSSNGVFNLEIAAALAVISSGRGFDDAQQFPRRRLDAALAQKLGGAFGIDRRAEIVALPVFATGRDEKLCLRFGFHPFRET